MQKKIRHIENILHTFNKAIKKKKFINIVLYNWILANAFQLIIIWTSSLSLFDNRFFCIGHTVIVLIIDMVF